MPPSPIIHQLDPVILAEFLAIIQILILRHYSSVPWTIMVNPEGAVGKRGEAAWGKPQWNTLCRLV